MRISAKADYAVRAMIELVSGSEESPLNDEAIAVAQGIPPSFMENILGDLGHHDLVRARRGRDGGYWLARGADEITIAEIISAVDGPLASVRGEPAESVDYRGDSKPLLGVWLALRTGVHQVLDSVTLADVVGGDLPESIQELAGNPDRSRFR